MSDPGPMEMSQQCGVLCQALSGTISRYILIWYNSLSYLFSDMGDCSVWHMGDPGPMKLPQQCGVLLSPGFPGFVQPAVWSWVLEAPPHLYYNLYVYYVKGPGQDVNQPECKEYFAGR